MLNREFISILNYGSDVNLSFLFKILLERTINPGDCGWLADMTLGLFSKLKRSNNCIKYPLEIFINDIS